MRTDWDRIDDAAGSFRPPNLCFWRYQVQRSIVEIEKLKPVSEAQERAIRIVLEMLRAEID